MRWSLEHRIDDYNPARDGNRLPQQMIANLLRRVAAYSPRSRRLLGTAAASYLARFAAAANLLITIPIARSSMTPESFGVWMMLGSLLGFFAFADLGIGNGVLNRVGDAARRNAQVESISIMLAGYACTLASALLVCAAWSLWLVGADDPLRFIGNVPETLRSEALSAFTAFVLLLALNIPLQLAQKFQLAYQDGHWVGFTQLACSTASLLALPVALHRGAGLVTLLLCTLGLQAVIQAASTLLWFHKKGFISLLARALLQRSEVTGLLRSGSLFFMLQLCAAFAFQSDAFVITKLLGQADYGDFAAIQRIYLSMGTLIGAALIGLWPAFGESLASGDMGWVRRTYLRTLGVGVALMGSLSLAVTLAMPWISQHWLHMSAVPPTALPLTLAIWTVIDTAGQITGTLLNGAGIVRAQLIVAIVMAGSCFAAKWLFVAQFGAWGAVLATIIAYTMISVPAQIWLLGKLPGKPASA